MPGHCSPVAKVQGKVRTQEKDSLKRPRHAASVEVEGFMSD